MGAPWVLVTGAGTNLQPTERNAAHLLGLLLAREGYNLIAGTWAGVDEHVTRAFVQGAGRQVCASRIIHVENHSISSGHDLRVGRVISSSAHEPYSEEAVSLADAGVIVSGRLGSKPTMDALIGIGKPVIPLAWLGQDGFASLQDVLRELRDVSPNHRRMLTALVDPLCAADETVSRTLGAMLGPEHAIFISFHHADAGADAGRLASHLCGLYGPRRVFIDYNSLLTGEHLDAVVAKASASRVLIALIGPKFESRTKRKADYVRREIVAANAGGAKVLSILNCREFESLGALPAPLRFLRSNVVGTLDRKRWDGSLLSLERSIDRALGVTQMR